MNILKEYLEKYRQYCLPIALVFIIALGIYFRVVSHSSLLVFKSDQARDALIMDGIFSGRASLPLLGPQIGGTTLRLGPVFYYFQYISGKVFGSSPQSLAYPDLMWGILALPMFYLLFRKLFSRGLSLWLLALASSSLLLVTFSRFAWNPNGLPFFTALFCYLFLTALEIKGKKRALYLCGAAVSIGIIAQLHLAAILGLGLGLVLFWILTQPLSWREVLGMIIVAVALHTPVLVNEWQTSGESVQLLIQAKEKKLSDEKGHTVYEKVFRAYQESSSFTWLTLTGQQNTDTILTKGFEFKCDKKCKRALPYTSSAILLFGFTVFASYIRWRVIRDETERKAITFIGCWLFGFFIITIVLAYQLQTRFYLGITVPIFIVLGFVAEYLYTLNKNIWTKRILVVLGGFIILLNLLATENFLHGLSRSQVSEEESSRDLRFGTEPKVTLGQLRSIAKEAAGNLDSNIPLVISGESHHVKALYYVMSREYSFTGCYIKGESNGISQDYNQLFLVETKPGKKEKFEGLNIFGTLSSEIKQGNKIDSLAKLPEDCLNY
jgi:4-amino-4-deoxy-L-arabinose transferase-like glycosyltransferase